jgi:glutathione peroxidase
MPTLYDFSARDLSGAEVPLDRFRGQVVLVVNTASQCGFTPQYAGLERLHQDLSSRGFAVLGFPCNQFGRQEPGDAAEIAAFCQTTFDVRFPMFGKIEVNGPQAHPLYRWLKHAAKGLLGSEAIKWNFTKFLVDRNGRAVARYAPKRTPEAIKPDVGLLL